MSTTTLKHYTMDGQIVRHVTTNPQAEVKEESPTPITGRQDYLLWEMGQHAMAAGIAFCGTEGNA